MGESETDNLLDQQIWAISQGYLCGLVEAEYKVRGLVLKSMCVQN